MPTPEPGIYHNVPFDEYASWEACHKSDLWLLNEQPLAKYRWVLDHGDKADREELLIGHATHTAILERDDFRTRYIIRPRTYENDKGEEKAFNLNSKVCKALLADLKKQGKLVLKRDHYELATRMRDAVWAHPTARLILEGGGVEVSIVWVDPKSGLLCKARIDVWHGPVLADIKTAECIAATRFGRASYRWGYHFQAGMYLDGAQIASGTEVNQFYIIAVEKEPPYLVKVYEVEQGDLDIGRAQRDWILEKVKQAQDTGQWPGYDADVSPLAIPSWAGQELMA